MSPADGKTAESAHDVLAAEAFAVPGSDPALRPQSLDLPQDLVGGEPREVLAAEEFAMPSPEEATRRRARRGSHVRAGVATGHARLVCAAVGGSVVVLTTVWMLLRRRRHHRDPASWRRRWFGR